MIRRAVAHPLWSLSPRRQRTEQETAANAIAAAKRIIEVPLSSSFNNWASTISNTEFGQPLNEGMLKRGQTRHHGYDGIA
jgi:hypothetical protein